MTDRPPVSGEPSTWRRFVNRLLDPARFCKCGLENAVDAVALYDSRTGQVKGHRWGVACPKAGVTFGIEPGYFRGNGWMPEHYHSADTHCPSWLDDRMAQELMAEATDFGYCGESHIPSRWLKGASDD